MFQTKLLKMLTFATLALTACAGGDARVDMSTPATSEFSLSIGAGRLTLQRSESVTLHASVAGTASRLYTLAFASSDPSVAAVSSEGLLEAMGAGATTITATATLLDTGTTATASVGVSVIDPSAPPPPVLTWTRCALEGVGSPGDVCAFSGRREVRYGVPGAYTTKVAEGSVACSDGAFGVTVATPYQNACDFSSALTTAPVTVVGGGTPPPPEPPPAPSTSVGPRVSSFINSGPIVAAAGQVISGVRISNPNGPCISIDVANVTVRDSELGPCGGSANVVVSGGASGVVIEFNSIHDGVRGVLVDRAANVATRNNTFTTFWGPNYGDGSAIEYDYSNNGVIDGNVVRGQNYHSDAVSFFESSAMRLTNNLIDVGITEPSSAGFTMGDMRPGEGNDPGHDNYVARNTVRQTGGVPAGVFGSSGNTILEKNCLTAGIQAYNYSGIFVGVTVRDNVINIGASFVPDTSIIAGWGTNLDGTDCSRVPN